MGRVDDDVPWRQGHPMDWPSLVEAADFFCYGSLALTLCAVLPDEKKKRLLRPNYRLLKVGNLPVSSLVPTVSEATAVRP